MIQILSKILITILIIIGVHYSGLIALLQFIVHSELPVFLVGCGTCFSLEMVPFSFLFQGVPGWFSTLGVLVQYGGCSGSVRNAFSSWFALGVGLSF